MSNAGYWRYPPSPIYGITAQVVHIREVNGRYDVQMVTGFAIEIDKDTAKRLGAKV